MKVNPIHVDVFHHYKPDDETVARLDRIECGIRALLRQGAIVSADLSVITAEVTEIKTVGAAAEALLTGLAAQIRDLATDPAAITALADSLDETSTSLAAAITANTPADPGLPPTP